jgi:tetratricopeptide (TPR) repeat protein
VEAYRRAFGFDHAKLALACSRLSKFQHLNGDIYGSRTNAQRAVSIARRCGDPETLADCLLEGAKSFSQSGRPAPEAIPWLREAMDLRRRVVPHLLALLDSTRLLVKALEDLASEGKLDEAKTILEEELKQDPSEGDLLSLLAAFNEPKPGP